MAEAVTALDGAADAGPMRVLLVDDDHQIVAGMARMLRMHRHDFAVEVETDPLRAVERLRETRFDAVMSDYRMPAMNGADLLQHVHDLQPHCARLVLSGHVDPSGLAEVAATAHQFLSKPAGRDEVVEALHRAQRMVRLLPDAAVRQRVMGPQRLMAQPQDLADLEKALDTEAADATDVARIIERSPSLAAKVLQLVNSSFFGPAVPVSALSQAVALVGTDLLRAMARLDALAVLTPPSLRVWARAQGSRAVERAARARSLAAERGLDRELAFSIGLLQDLGILLLVDEAGPTRDPAWLVEAEARIAPATHGAVGAYLLGLWGLPLPLVDAVASHADPDGHPLLEVVAEAARETGTACPLTVHDDADGASHTHTEVGAA